MLQVHLQLFSFCCALGDNKFSFFPLLFPAIAVWLHLQLALYLPLFSPQKFELPFQNQLVILGGQFKSHLTDLTLKPAQLSVQSQNQTFRGHLILGNHPATHRTSCSSQPNPRTRKCQFHSLGRVHSFLCYSLANFTEQ